MASRHIVVDPVTRIEGHLRIEAVLDNDNVIREAYSAGTMFRGIERILQGRDPRDAGLLAQRICGVCTGVHYAASIRAVEDAFGITVPKNARLVRNLLHGSILLRDHVVHFYQLHALDWVDLLSALQANPRRAAAVALRYSDNPWNSGEAHYRAVQAKLTNFAKQGSLGIFGNAYWGHPAYKLTPEENLVAVSHYLDALTVQRNAGKMTAIFGAKDPHSQSTVVGGVTCVQDLQDPQRLSQFGSLLAETIDFINRAYLPDVLMAGKAYAGEAAAGIGAGLGSYLAYGYFEQDDNPIYQAKTLFPRGLVLDRDLTRVLAFDQGKVAEDVTHSWYQGSATLHPYDGVTEPDYTGLDHRNGVAYLKTAGKYSWLKSPTYDDHRVEVGPLARLIVGYVSGDTNIRRHVDAVLTAAGLPISVLFSTLGRTAARAVETVIVAEAMQGWLTELQENVAGGDLATWTSFDFDSVSHSARGHGLVEAPRGALGHWVRVENGKIENYQAVVPTTWNASPRDGKGRVGAYESALTGIHLAKPDQPLEILRTVHSFDPCLACAVHVVDARGRELGSYQIDPLGGSHG